MKDVRKTLFNALLCYNEIIGIHIVGQEIDG